MTVSLDFYRQEYRNALRNGADAMLAFRTKLLNVYAENQKRAWISATLARSVARQMPLESITGYPDAMVAIDLSESDDFSAVTVGLYNEAAKEFQFNTSYFFPEKALPEHPNEKLYRKWAEGGHLMLLPGDVIDYRAIVDHVLGMTRYVNIRGIGYDPYKSLDVVNMLSNAGADKVLKGIRQTYGSFTASVESFEHGIKTGHIYINDNPINYYCFGNAVLDYDNLDNCKPTKRTPNHKIDGVITMLMCMKQFIDLVN